MTVEELAQRLELRVAVGGRRFREVAAATAATCSVG